MALRIYNSLTRRKDPFEPLEAGKVRMYVCGITAYDLCHVGHARAAVIFDVIDRFLVSLGYEVAYVRNFTDYRFSQVFYPTRGIMAYYDTKTHEIRGIPGADDPKFLHANAVFTPDGKTLAMDVDGPDGDKGAYTLVPVRAETVVDNEHVMSWNALPGKPAGTMTLGFLSRVSPDGRYAGSTVNEMLYVRNFTDYDIDVAEPTRESRPVNPVVEHDRGKTGAFGMFLDDHSSIFGWRRIVPRN